MIIFDVICPACSAGETSRISMQDAETKLTGHFCPVANRRVSIDARDPNNIIVKDVNTPRDNSKN